MRPTRRIIHPPRAPSLRTCHSKPHQPQQPNPTPRSPAPPRLPPPTPRICLAHAHRSPTAASLHATPVRRAHHNPHTNRQQQIERAPMQALLRHWHALSCLHRPQSATASKAAEPSQQHPPTSSEGAHDASPIYHPPPSPHVTARTSSPRGVSHRNYEENRNTRRVGWSQMKRRLELYSAAFGTVLFLALFACSCVSREFTARDSVILGLIAIGFGIGWYRLRKAT